MTNVTGNSSIVSDPAPLEVLAPPGNLFNNSVGGNPYKYGAMGALFVGYGMVFDNHSYLGAELGVNFLGANETKLRSTSTNTVTGTTALPPLFEEFTSYTSTATTQTKVTRNNVEPFLDIKAGFLVTPTALVYLRGGINYNSLKTKSNSSFNITGVTAFDDPGEDSGSDIASAASSLSSTHKKNTVGFRLGIGGEVMVTPEFGIGADYVYSWYKKLNTSASGLGSSVICDEFLGPVCTVVPASVETSTNVKLSDQQVMAQFIYHMG
jgi:opacity protein-like surface antigen